MRNVEGRYGIQNIYYVLYSWKFIMIVYQFQDIYCNPQYPFATNMKLNMYLIMKLQLIAI